MRKLMFLPLFSLVLLAGMCDDSDIEQIATSLNRATKAVGVVQDTVIAAHDTLGEEVFPKKDADAIVIICKEVQMAIVLANNLTRDFSELPPGGRNQLLEILIPVMDTLEVAVSTERLALIKDDNLRAAVALGFRTALGVMQTAQLILETTDAN
jgi:hypothetical protein